MKLPTSSNSLLNVEGHGPGISFFRVVCYLRDQEDVCVFPLGSGSPTLCIRLHNLHTFSRPSIHHGSHDTDLFRCHFYFSRGIADRSPSPSNPRGIPIPCTLCVPCLTDINFFFVAD